jgi:hypothetical protein
LLLDRFTNFIVLACFEVEGQLAHAQHVEETDPYAPEVDTFIITTSRCELWGTKLGLSCLSLHLQGALVLDSYVEIQELNLGKIVCHEKVAGLYVSMADFSLMKVLHCFKELGYNHSYVFFLQNVLILVHFGDLISEVLSTFAYFHHHLNPLVYRGIKYVVDPDHARVAEGAQEFEFFFGYVEELVVFYPHNFDCEFLLSV